MADEQVVETVEESPEEKQGKEARKVAALFDKNMKTLVAVFKGNQSILNGKGKIPNDAHDELMKEIFDEEEKDAKEKFKVKAKNLIKSKVEFDRFIAEKKKEFDNAVTNKKKEFNKEMGDTFNLLVSVDKLKDAFYNSVPADELETKDSQQQTN